ncbi:MAG: helix-turn-helix transcriptional regulator [Clostridiales bacterium]|nr:helix-turn-helix transcriptional regulator [Clostridiales bacterium]
MEGIKLNEQIAFLRRQKNLTQEELANALGVTNQAVSKWEASQCCPDIQLLPELAKLFGVSIDELMGYRKVDTFENVYLKIKSLFQAAPAETAFHNAFRIGILLHEVACTRGYKSYIPWDTDKNHGLEDQPYRWGFSACSEPEGTTVFTGNGVFISDGASYQSPTPAQIRNLYLSLERLCDRNVLKVLYALYDLTVHDFNVYVSLADIADKSKLTENDVMKVLENIPVEIKENDHGISLYRITGCYMHIPSLLLLLIER